MQIIGFLLINIYALLLIVSTFIIFISKSRLKQQEDELYKKFLIVNILMSVSGLFLGVLVSSPGYSSFIISIFNKLYLFCLLWWIYLLTYYYMYISFSNKEKISNMKKKLSVFAHISTFLIFFLPITVETSAEGAVAAGPAIMYTYSVFSLAFLFQIVCVFINIKNFANKKYIPLYTLILIGSVVLICMIINPSLNYIVNPGFIFVSYIMYHTIENPDIRMIEELNKSKSKLENTNVDNRKLIERITEDLRGINYDMNDIIEGVLSNTTEDDTKEAMYKLRYYLSDVRIKLNGTLDISSMDARNIKITNNKYDLRKIVQEIELRMKDSIPSGVEYSHDIVDTIPETLYGESVKMKQIITSLLQNAFQYTKEGSVELRCYPIIKDDICKLMIAVVDTGVGMDLHQINKVMVNDNDLTEEDLERYNELNLNLKTVKKMVEVMGGTFVINSEVGKGTKVAITLNQKIYHEADDKHLEAIEKQVFDKKTIAVIGEHLTTRKSIVKSLIREDFNIIECSTAKECLDIIRKDQKIDIIISEENMDKIDARGLLEKLKNEEKSIPIILVTEEDEYNLKHIKLEGFASCVSIQEISSELLKKINMLFENK